GRLPLGQTLNLNLSLRVMSSSSVHPARYGGAGRYRCRRAVSKTEFIYLTVGKSGLDTSYVCPGRVSSAASFSAFSSVRSVVPQTTTRPSSNVSVIDATDGAAIRWTCRATSGFNAVSTPSAALVAGSLGPGLSTSRYGTPGGGAAIAKSTPSRSYRCVPSAKSLTATGIRSTTVTRSDDG